MHSCAWGFKFQFRRIICENKLAMSTLGSYNFRAIFTHAWAGVTTLCSCKYFGNIDNPDPLMQYTNKKVITSIFCWSRILHEKISLYGEFMNYLKKCARHFLNLKTSFSWDDPIMEPTTVGSLWLENDLHENELEFESYMGRSKKNVRVTSDGIHAEIHEIWTCVAPAAPPLFHAAVNPCLHRESAWNWSCNSVNLGKSTVTWMRRHYVFTVISRWSTFSSTVNVCNINCVIFSDTHCSFGPPILWHSPFHAGVSVY